jgi:formylglycine-generating enzyme required for sulfatase activity
MVNAARTAALRSALALVALQALVWSCYPSRPSAVGRPCSPGGSCGPGARCEPTSRTCVAEADSGLRPDGTLPPDARPACVQPPVEKSYVLETVITVQGQGIRLPSMCVVPRGCFFMGSPPTEPCRASDLRETRHEVTLTRPFEIGEREVTQEDFNANLGYNPSLNQTPPCPTCPAENVSWHEAVAYCNTLSVAERLDECYVASRDTAACSATSECLPDWVCMKASQTKRCTRYAVAPKYAGPSIYSCPGYRLATEAEWEYAYRAGTTTPLYSGDVTHCDERDDNADRIAWYGHQDGYSTPVGTRQANGWGLLDAAGNVAEWCHDSYVADLGAAAVSDPVFDPVAPARVIRGGSYFDWPRALRASSRGGFGASGAKGIIGFRCAITRWSCGQVARCKMRCGIEPACLTLCERHACASAIPKVNDVTACATSACLTDCAAGFDEEKCQPCVVKNCPSTWFACMDHRC